MRNAAAFQTLRSIRWLYPRVAPRVAPRRYIGPHAREEEENERGEGEAINASAARVASSRSTGRSTGCQESRSPKEKTPSPLDVTPFDGSPRAEKKESRSNAIRRAECTRDRYGDLHVERQTTKELRQINVYFNLDIRTSRTSRTNKRHNCELRVFRACALYSARAF